MASCIPDNNKLGNCNTEEFSGFYTYLCDPFIGITWYCFTGKMIVSQDDSMRIG